MTIEIIECIKTPRGDLVLDRNGCHFSVTLYGRDGNDVLTEPMGNGRTARAVFAAALRRCAK